MFDTLANLIDSFGKLFPRIRLIDKQSGGVKFKTRGRVKILKPGLYFYWPILTELRAYPIVRQVLNLPYQTLMTSDLKSIVVAGVIVYEINDLEKYGVENYDVLESITEMGCTAIRSVIVTKTLAEIQQNNRNTIDNALTKSAKQQLEIFGLNVHYARLTDFSIAKILNLVGGEPFKQRGNDYYTDY